MKAECTKRKLDFDKGASALDLAVLIANDDNKPADWGKIYSRVLYHTSMGYDEIGQRSRAQIKAILDEAGENINMASGIFGGIGYVGPSSPPPPDFMEESTQEDVESFFGSF